VKRLILIRAAGERCVLAAHGETPGTYALTLCDAIGSPVASKTTEVEPRAAAMTSTHVVVASHSVVFLWRYRGGGGTDDETRTFHVDSDARDGSFGDASSYGASNDPVTAVAASEKTLLVARKSGAMTKFGLPGFISEGRLATKCRARVLALNCKGTKFAAIDASGTLSVFDVPPKSSENAAAKPVPVKATFQKKDAWDVRWSDDDEHALAAMEKTKMVVYRGAEPEQPCGVFRAHLRVPRPDRARRGAGRDHARRKRRFF
jgi:WD repeat-containing protein 35